MLKLAECSRKVHSSLIKLVGRWKGSMCWCLIDCSQGNSQFRGLCLSYHHTHRRDFQANLPDWSLDSGKFGCWRPGRSMTSNSGRNSILERNRTNKNLRQAEIVTSLHNIIIVICQLSFSTKHWATNHRKHWNLISLVLIYFPRKKLLWIQL